MFILHYKMKQDDFVDFYKFFLAPGVAALTLNRSPIVTGFIETCVKKYFIKTKFVETAVFGSAHFFSKNLRKFIVSTFLKYFHSLFATYETLSICFFPILISKVSRFSIARSLATIIKPVLIVQEKI